MLPGAQDVPLSPPTTFAWDYHALRRWYLEEGLHAVTIEPTGRVVFTSFDTDPAVFAAVATSEHGLDEVAEGAAPRGHERLWSAAAEQLRRERRPGRTAFFALSVSGSLGGVRQHVRPHDFSLDGQPVSAPHYPGPRAAGRVDERPTLVVGGAPFVIVAAPGAHRLEGSVTTFDEAGAPTLGTFAADVRLAGGERVALELVRASEGLHPFALRPTRRPGSI